MFPDDTFRKTVRDALEHIHDLAYLETHPLAVQLRQPASYLQATRGQKLRAVLNDTLEKLRPHQDAPSGAPEWRSYLALRYRYVQDMSMGEIENKLGISLRQLHRELHKGQEALCSLLWEMRATDEAPAPTAPPADSSPSVQELQGELNQWQLDRQSHPVRSLVNDAIGMLKPLLEQRAIAMEVDLPAGLAPVLVDATLVRQALFKTLRLIAQTAQSPLVMRATQTGEQVNITYYCRAPRLDAAGEEWQMVELLLAHQGGGLKIDHGEEDQAVVELRLPRAGQLHVLVIDDNPSIHQLFERYLSLHHYKVLHARSGQEALEMVSGSPPEIAGSPPEIAGSPLEAAGDAPDAIILDVMMPGTDGWQVLRDLAANSATRSIPVIVCSVLKEPELALSLGARAYLKKPVERVDLLETLARLLRSAGPAAEENSTAPAGS